MDQNRNSTVMDIIKKNNPLKKQYCTSRNLKDPVSFLNKDQKRDGPLTQDTNLFSLTNNFDMTRNMVMTNPKHKSLTTSPNALLDVSKNLENTINSENELPLKKIRKIKKNNSIIP